MKCLQDYARLVGGEAISEIREKASGLRGRRIVHINSTNEGGGVAELLNSVVPLMNDIGVETDWKILNGTSDFFTLTKGFHNALQGGSVELDELKEHLYTLTNAAFCTYASIDADCVVVHDPQPLPLIKFHKKKQPWIWRCHVDLSNPNQTLWEFLKKFIIEYDLVVMSSEKYKKKDLQLEQRIICPAIDPLSDKNMWLSREEIINHIQKAEIPIDKPLITQVARMDQWKDPEGLLEVFEQIKARFDCRLVYCHSPASDDPEGTEVLSTTLRKAQKLVQSGDVIFVNGTNQLFVNALQRFSTIIVQKSISEGFCLSITEALWKEKPVVATNVGGIPAQLREAENGFLVEPYDTTGFADKVVQLLQNPDLAEQMGRKGKEIVNNDFLVTRLISDYLDLYSTLLDGHN